MPQVVLKDEAFSLCARVLCDLCEAHVVRSLFVLLVEYGLASLVPSRVVQVHHDCVHAPLVVGKHEGAVTMAGLNARTRKPRNGLSCLCLCLSLALALLHHVPNLSLATYFVNLKKGPISWRREKLLEKKRARYLMHSLIAYGRHTSLSLMPYPNGRA